MNKTLILILCIIIGALNLQAQTQKGNQLLGGNVSFGTSKGTSDYSYLAPGYSSSANSTVKAYSFFIGPNYSYFIADNLDLGISGGFGTSKTTNTYSYYNNYTGLTEISNRSYSAAAYLRKHFLYKQKLGVRTGPYALYQYNNYKYAYLNDQINNGNQTGHTINSGLGLDLVYFPGRRLGIASSLGSLAYTHNDTKGYSTHDKSDVVSLSLTSALNLSVFYCLGK
jgi:hypothetical protein